MNEIFAKNHSNLLKIELNDVYFFTKKNNKVVAVLKNENIELSTSLYMISELVAKNPNFFRAHKSFIININKMQCISKYNSRTYNISFKGINTQAYITQKSLNVLSKKILII